MEKRSSLMTPDPYHIPGYGGYIPQFKYRIGKTFGNHTHSLLSRGSVACSVLGGSVDAKFDTLEANNTKPLATKGNLKYTTEIIPGYTGYIPKALNYFGSRYTKLSQLAVSEFKNKQKQHKQLGQEISLQSTSNKPSTYIPVHCRKHQSTSLQGDEDHQGSFISGYTGFIPRAQKYIGEGYPTITRKALTDHVKESNRQRVLQNKPFNLYKVYNIKPSMVLYSQINHGLMPHYTGEKYKYGMTFGTTTRQALSEIASH